MPTEPELTKIAVEHELRCRATLAESRTATAERLGIENSRFVYTFNLNGHPSAGRAYAWKKGDELAIVLQGAGVNSPEDALGSEAGRDLQADAQRNVVLIKRSRYRLHWCWVV